MNPSVQNDSVQLTETSQPSATLLAVRTEEADRAKIFALFVGFVCGLGLFSVPFLGGSYGLQIATWISLALLFSSCVWVVLRARHGRFDKPTSRVFVLFGIFAVTMVVIYYGIFSPAPIVMVLGLGFFGASDDRRFIDLIFGFYVLTYAVLSILVLGNWLEDPGLVTVQASSIWVRIFVALTVPAISLGALWQARSARKVALDAMARMHDAILVEERQRIQLAEINQDLAVKAGGGHLGRFSGRREGRWTFGSVVGRGAMGEVYKASDPEGLEVAIKVLMPRAHERGPSVLLRFKREAEVLQRLSHPGITKIYNVGEIDDTPFLVMELLSGMDLAQLLRKESIIRPSEISQMVQEVASALAAAHQLGVVHRDIKPSNLFASIREGEQSWKILDFGISQVQDSSGNLTSQGVAVGTPAYMAPEQAQDREVDTRADIFSLAGVVYRSLTGLPPFLGSSSMSILYQVVNHNPRAPSAVNAKLPEAVDFVLAIALAKKVAQRFASMDEFSDTLRLALTGEISKELKERAAHILQAYPWDIRVIHHKPIEPESSDSIDPPGSGTTQLKEPKLS